MDLFGKTALIIGGTSGIGSAIAISLAEEGVQTTVVGRNQKKYDESNKFKEMQIQFIKADITEEEEVKNIFFAFENLDILVITAATPAAGKISELSTEKIEKVFKTKFFGAFWAVKYGLPKINCGGCIITISGIWGHKPPAGFVAGAAVNGSIEGMTRALAVELAGKGIRVNCISPGITKTKSYIDEMNDNYRSYLESILLKRFGMPEDVAEGALFLVKNKYITGTVLFIDGGNLISI